MADQDEISTSPIGFTQRDLIIQANTKLDGLGSEMKDIRAEQVRLRGDVDNLKTAQAVRKAESGVGLNTRRAAMAILALMAYWFGPIVDKAITHS